MECGDDMVADDEVRASHGGRRNQGLLWFFGASATLGVAAVTAITCAVIRYGWNDGEFWKLVVPAAVALVAAIVWAALGFMRRAGRSGRRERYQPGRIQVRFGGRPDSGDRRHQRVGRHVHRLRYVPD